MFLPDSIFLLWFLRDFFVFSSTCSRNCVTEIWLRHLSMNRLKLRGLNFIAWIFVIFYLYSYKVGGMQGGTCLQALGVFYIENLFYCFYRMPSGLQAWMPINEIYYYYYCYDYPIYCVKPLGSKVKCTILIERKSIFYTVVTRMEQKYTSFPLHF